MAFKSASWYLQQTSCLRILEPQLLWDYSAADYRGAEDAEVRSAAGAHTEMSLCASDAVKSNWRTTETE